MDIVISPCVDPLISATRGRYSPDIRHTVPEIEEVTMSEETMVGEVTAEPRSGEGRAASSAAAQHDIAAEPRSGEGRAASSAAAQHDIEPAPVEDLADDAADEALLENLLVEEVSIDGMCGVY
jgi:mycofactocin precursor